MRMFGEHIGEADYTVVKVTIACSLISRPLQNRLWHQHKVSYMQDFKK